MAKATKPAAKQQFPFQKKGAEPKKGSQAASPKGKQMAGKKGC